MGSRPKAASDIGHRGRGRQAFAPGREPQGGRAVGGQAHAVTRGARTEFLATIQCDTLFLVGDIVDGWRLRKSWRCDAAHDEVLRLVLRDWLPPGLEIAGVRLADEAEHVTAAGLRLLVTHGDQFDSVVCYAKLLAHLGDSAYTAALPTNRLFNHVRRRLGYPRWSLSQWLKQQAKGAVAAIDRFEEALAPHAGNRGFDGVVCGHIHHAQMREIGGVLYVNDGDWVESCTAPVEHRDGRLELLEWARCRQLSFHGRQGARPAPPQADKGVPQASRPVGDVPA